MKFQVGDRIKVPGIVWFDYLITEILPGRKMYKMKRFSQGRYESDQYLLFKDEDKYVKE